MHWPASQPRLLLSMQYPTLVATWYVPARTFKGDKAVANNRNETSAARKPVSGGRVEGRGRTAGRARRAGCLGGCARQGRLQTSLQPRRALADRLALLAAGPGGMPCTAGPAADSVAAPTGPSPAGWFCLRVAGLLASARAGPVRARLREPRAQ